MVFLTVTEDTATMVVTMELDQLMVPELLQQII